jgi:hypothetical protein
LIGGFFQPQKNAECAKWGIVADGNLMLFFSSEERIYGQGAVQRWQKWELSDGCGSIFLKIDIFFSG